MRRSSDRRWVGAQRARVADSDPAGLIGRKRTGTNYLAVIPPGENVADPDVRHAVADLVRRAVALVAAFHADIAEDSPRLSYALEYILLTYRQ